MTTAVVYATDLVVALGTAVVGLQVATLENCSVCMGV